MKRNSNIELLRIICALMIVAHHYSLHGMGAAWNYDYLPIAKMYVEFLGMFGKLAVNVFFIISGYFLVKSKFKISRIIKVIFEVYFYSISIYIVAKYALHLDLSSNIAFNPIGNNLYWFATTYIFLVIISPIINEIIKRINSRILLLLISSLVFFNSIFPLLIENTNEPNYLLWAVIMYLIGAYIKLSDTRGLKNNYNNLLIFSLSMFFVFLLIQLGNIYYINHLDSTYYTLYPSNMNFILIVIASIFLFIYFNNLSFSNELVNKVANTSFGIYLIHDNAMIRNYIWHNLFHCSNYAYSGTKIIFISILTIFIVFIISMIIDMIRIIIFDKAKKILISIKEKF